MRACGFDSANGKERAHISKGAGKVCAVFSTTGRRNLRGAILGVE